jgi:hypothetical protein
LAVDLFQGNELGLKVFALNFRVLGQGKNFGLTVAAELFKVAVHLVYDVRVLVFTASVFFVMSLYIFSMLVVKYLNFLAVLCVQSLNRISMSANEYLNFVSELLVLYLNFLAEGKLALLQALAEGSHVAALLRLQVILLLQVRLLGASSLLRHLLDGAVAGLDSSAELFLVETVLFGVLLDLDGNLLNVSLQLGSGLLAHAEHGLLFVEILLDVHEGSHFNVEAHKQVLEVFLVGLAALQVDVKIAVVALL